MGAEQAKTSRVLIVDDHEDNVEVIRARLEASGYQVESAADGEEALDRVRDCPPDLILLDVMMPRIDGMEVARRIKGDETLPFIPIIMQTALDTVEHKVEGLGAGADDYVTKPINFAELEARVKSMLRIKALHDTVQELNRTLERRVAEQVGQLDRLGRLKRFFSPQLAELIVAGGAEDPLRTHRREVTVVFVDLRGFTAFAEMAEPEEVMAVLREYHAELGRLVLAHEGTLERFAGDGMMIFFNDPVPVPDPAERAVRMALAMRERVRALTERWRKSGHDLDFGVGIAQGYATIGAIGFEGRWDYGAIGTVTNLAARLCGEARPGQILVSRRLYTAVEMLVEAEPVGELMLKGFARPVTAFNVLRTRAANAAAGRG
jgi:class 3 adenylate cyclase